MDSVTAAAEKIYLGMDTSIATIVVGVLRPGSEVPVVEAIPNDGESVRRLAGPRVPGRNTHGTGCTLASAIACYLARGADMPQAVAQAKVYVTGAIRAGFPLGHTIHGIGPVDPAWQWREQISG